MPKLYEYMGIVLFSTATNINQSTYMENTQSANQKLKFIYLTAKLPKSYLKTKTQV